MWVSDTRLRRILLALGGGAFAIGLVFGLLGVRTLAAADPVFLGSTWKRLLQLMFFRLPVHLVEHLPAVVRLAQMAFVISLLLFVGAGLIAVFRRRWASFVISRAHGHVVLCADGRQALGLLQPLIESGRRVVALIPDDQGELSSLERRSDVLVVRGDATAESDLLDVSTHTAHSVIVTQSSDSAVLAITTAVEAVCEQRRATPGDPLRCVAEIHDDQLWHSLARMEPIVARRRMERRFLFREQAVARRLLREHPPSSTGGTRVSTLIVGATRVGLQILLEHLRYGMVDERGPTITLLDEDATRHESALRDRFPQLDRLCTLEARDLRTEGTQAQLVETLQSSGGTFTSVYLCLETLAESIAFGSSLCEAARAGYKLPRLHVYAPGQDRLFDDALNMLPFGAAYGRFSSENLFEERGDLLARAVHEQYLEEMRRQGETPEGKPALRPWNELATTYREASRRQADHAEYKLRQVGCRSVATDTQESIEFSTEEIELLARLEHTRWVADRFLDGWRFGSVRDDEHRVHPSLLPYDDLDETTKEIDRATVRALPELFGRVGRSIKRVTAK